jgi:hypothetical protein
LVFNKQEKGKKVVLSGMILSFKGDFNTKITSKQKKSKNLIDFFFQQTICDGGNLTGTEYSTNFVGEVSVSFNS